MAKLTAFFTSILVLVQCLFGIGSLELGKPALVLEKDSYSAQTETIEAQLYNYSCKAIGVGPYAYTLERWEDNAWTNIPLKASVEIPDAFFLLQPFQSAGKSFHLADHEGVTAGRYRVAASGSAWAEFELT